MSRWKLAQGRILSRAVLQRIAARGALGQDRIVTQSSALSGLHMSWGSVTNEGAARAYHGCVVRRQQEKQGKSEGDEYGPVTVDLMVTGRLSYQAGQRGSGFGATVRVVDHLSRVRDPAWQGGEGRPLLAVGVAHPLAPSHQVTYNIIQDDKVLRQLTLEREEPELALAGADAQDSGAVGGLGRVSAKQRLKIVATLEELLRENPLAENTLSVDHAAVMKLLKCDEERSVALRVSGRDGGKLCAYVVVSRNPLVVTRFDVKVAPKLVVAAGGKEGADADAEAAGEALQVVVSTRVGKCNRSPVEVTMNGEEFCEATVEELLQLVSTLREEKHFVEGGHMVAMGEVQAAVNEYEVDQYRVCVEDRFLDGDGLVMQNNVVRLCLVMMGIQSETPQYVPLLIGVLPSREQMMGRQGMGGDGGAMLAFGEDAEATVGFMIPSVKNEFPMVGAACGGPS